mgnify:CR=1 FL=1
MSACFFLCWLQGSSLRFCADLCPVLIGFGKLEAVAEYFKLRFLFIVSVRWRGLEFYWGRRMDKTPYRCLYC